MTIIWSQEASWPCMCHIPDGSKEQTHIAALLVAPMSTK